MIQTISSSPGGDIIMVDEKRIQSNINNINKIDVISSTD